jgi:hypothetical protein
VVANPSSYAYLTADRPRSARDCDASFNEWKFGLNALPPYARAPQDPDLKSGFLEGLRRAYLERDVIYLLGTNDDNPDGEDLDQSCEANAQGHSRLSRGASYFAYLRKELPDFQHRLQLVFGVGHSARAMFTSTCGLAALFDTGDCDLSK